MEERKDKSSRIIAIIALVVAVFGVSLGFAAFSQNLEIKPAAEVKGDESKFDVQFSTKNNEVASGAVNAVLEPSGDEQFTAEAANLTATTVSNIKASFQNGKGSQKATYTFYVYNNGELNAYLKKVTFGQAEPKCTAKEGTSADLVKTACDDVTMKIDIDGDVYQATNDTISGKLLSTGGNKTVTVTLEYNDKNPVDGDFDVDFGTITLNYSSSDGE